MAEEAKWYVVHTYSGYENTVKLTIEKTINKRNLQDVIQQVLIPMETVTEFVERKKKTEDGKYVKDENGNYITEEVERTVERKIYPGYVMVKMVMTDEAWYIVNSVRGVTGFVGSDAEAKPMIRAVALSEDEVYQLGIERRVIEVPYKVGDTVMIVDGALTNFTGKVVDLDVEQDAVRVEVTMMGRPTPVELMLDQVELVTE